MTMSENEIRVGDVGTVFEITLKDGDTVVNIAAATTKQIKFRLPDETTVGYAATLTTDGTDGKLQYETDTTTTLSLPGKWEMQAYIASASGAWNSDIHKFFVYKNIDLS